MSLKRLLWVLGVCVGFMLGDGFGLLVAGYWWGAIPLVFGIGLGVLHWFILLPNSKPPYDLR